LKAAGIKDMNNEEAQEYGLQCGAEEDGSIIGSAEYVLGGGGLDGLGGSNSFLQPTFDSVILSSCIGMLLEYRSCIMKRSVAD
jgi:hypothetical protein